MKYMSAAHTDVGIRKKTNQDSLLIEEANTDYGKVILAVICDGMGGLAKGELASATLIQNISQWFRLEFPQILYQHHINQEDFQNCLCQGLDRLIQDTNMQIGNYGYDNHTSLGTTVTLLLLIEGKYYIANVGDSRIYLITNQLHQLTKDQTYIQRELDLGHMTLEEAQNDPQRNVLLQCVGASDTVIPDFFTGDYETEQMFLLCSDGFRHVLTPDELYQNLNVYILKTEDAMQESLQYLTEWNKSRMERDNITSALIRVCK